MQQTGRCRLVATRARNRALLLPRNPQMSNGDRLPCSRLSIDCMVWSAGLIG